MREAVWLKNGKEISWVDPVEDIEYDDDITKIRVFNGNYWYDASDCNEVPDGFYIREKEEGVNKMKINITREELKNWTLSEYNEDTNEQLDYYINEQKCNVGDKAYLYSHEEDEFTEMKILQIIRRSEDVEYYDELLGNEDVLLDGEDEYDADTSAEFITDNDCYLVWFVYV